MYWIVARYGEYSCSVGHYDVFALTRDPKAGLFQRPNSIQMIDAR